MIDVGYNWIAKDKDGDVYIYRTMPEYEQGQWQEEGHWISGDPLKVKTDIFDNTRAKKSLRLISTIVTLTEDV